MHENYRQKQAALQTIIVSMHGLLVNALLFSSFFSSFPFLPKPRRSTFYFYRDLSTSRTRFGCVRLIRPSVWYTKTSKMLTVIAYFQRRSPKWIFSKTLITHFVWTTANLYLREPLRRKISKSLRLNKAFNISWLSFRRILI